MIDHILDYIERYKYAIIGTTVVHIAFFFYANFTTVDQPFKFPDPEVEMSVPLDDVEIDEETLKQMEQMQQLQNNMPSEEVYNMATDASDNRKKSYENYSTQQMDQQVQQEAKQLEQQYFEEWASTHEGQFPKSGRGQEKDETSNQESRNNDVNEQTIKTGGANAFAGEVLVSYYLPDRKAHDLPKPGYTCNSSGTVVLDIKVDKAGDVKSVSFNPNLSKGATECMVEKALKYAKRSRFNFSGSADNNQNGTITYKFVSK